jgi:hypothetical protein
MANQLAVPSLGQGAALSPQPVAFPYKSGQPPEGNKTALVLFTLPPNALSGQTIVDVSQFGMSMVQSLMCDNEGNDVAITVQAGDAGLAFGIQPLGTQIIPVFQASTQLKITVSVSTPQAQALSIAFQIFNAFVPPASWVSNLAVNGNVNVASITGTVNVAVQGTAPVDIVGGSVMIAGGAVDVTGSTIDLAGGVSISSSALGGARYALYNPLTNVVVSLKNAQGTFKGIGNSSAAAGFVQVFDAAAPAAVTLGVTVPNMVLPLPFLGNLCPEGLAFINGIQLACTSTATGNIAPGAPPIIMGYYA